jgi:hypothetical protein
VIIALPFARVDTAFVAAPDPQSLTGLNERAEKGLPAAPSWGVKLWRCIPKQYLAHIGPFKY